MALMCRHRQLVKFTTGSEELSSVNEPRGLSLGWCLSNIVVGYFTDRDSGYFLKSQTSGSKHRLKVHTIMILVNWFQIFARARPRDWAHRLTSHSTSLHQVPRQFTLTWPDERVRRSRGRTRWPPGRIKEKSWSVLSSPGTPPLQLFHGCKNVSSSLAH